MDNVVELDSERRKLRQRAAHAADEVLAASLNVADDLRLVGLMETARDYLALAERARELRVRLPGSRPPKAA